MAHGSEIAGDAATGGGVSCEPANRPPGFGTDRRAQDQGHPHVDSARSRQRCRGQAKGKPRRAIRLRIDIVNMPVAWTAVPGAAEEPPRRAVGLYFGRTGYRNEEARQGPATKSENAQATVLVGQEPWRSGGVESLQGVGSHCGFGVNRRR